MTRVSGEVVRGDIARSPCICHNAVPADHAGIQGWSQARGRAKLGNREDHSVMEKRLVSVLGTSAKHILSALQRAFRAVAVTGLITALIVGVGTEGVAFALSGKFPPSGVTHLAAAALAVAFGYAAAITVAVEEILRAIIKTIELIVEESEKLAAAAVKEGEHLLGEGGTDLLKLGRGALHEASALSRGALGAAETVGRDAAGIVGGIGAAVGHEAHALEAHLPGHHDANATSDSGAKR
ncbi:MAG TPA: hypothetical protein VID73_12440 [Ktedonobacterales bacterium]